MNEVASNWAVVALNNRRVLESPTTSVPSTCENLERKRGVGRRDGRSTRHVIVSDASSVGAWPRHHENASVGATQLLQ